MRQSFFALAAENQEMRGEARMLMSNLEELKSSLRKLADYSTKLGEMTKLTVDKVSQKTGIGPLSPEEFKKSQEMPKETLSNHIPLGLNIEKLAFKPVFDEMRVIGRQSGGQALQLQQLVATLSQRQNLLSAIPSVAPVNGWVTSNFGTRISPFTGTEAFHQGLDIAAPVGMPIYAPANGVVIFTGSKDGFGNYIMIAHGYGISTSYGHIAENLVRAGQKITRGEQIATIGMSGRTTGPHLHYEVWLNGRPNDPKNFILDLATAH